MAYQSFSNFVTRLVKNYVQRYPKDEREEKEIECIQQYFSNRYMIIDEVHNIRDEQGSETRDTIKTIEKVIKYSHNLRLVLLTATPMYNRSTEIIWILNMMLLNDNRPIIDTKTIFDKDGVLLESGKKILEDKCRGYISYLRGENPITFPIRLYPKQLKNKHNKQLYSDYSKSKQISIISRTNRSISAPRLNLVGGKILCFALSVLIACFRHSNRSLRFLSDFKSIKSTTIIPPISLSLNCRATSFADSRFTSSAFSS